MRELIFSLVKLRRFGDDLLTFTECKFVIGPQLESFAFCKSKGAIALARIAGCETKTIAAL